VQVSGLGPVTWVGYNTTTRMVAAASSNWVPTRLGQFEVVGELATGGMAQILLARMAGPSGFQRTVVIKRILPHLARDEAFVAMFTDEANTVSRIRHPNVVSVEMLCRDDGELYLVMEYLEGESLFGVMRGLLRLKRKLPYELIAHLLAEACAGLHGAHELKGPDGKSVNLVHRDVSPHNIFVTYAGGVKVIDFGIAKTDNRKNRTETGQLKGKFEYMSPEQCAAEPCDRRTDVYALGIVLYELITGQRLFKRANELLTIKAVTEGPIIPPTVLCPDCPGRLEQIVMRALERDPKQRYQTCDEMCADLQSLLRQDKRLEASPEALMARFMQDLFAERIDDKKKMIAEIAKGEAPKSLPPPDVDLQYVLPEIDEAALRNHTHMRSVPGATVKATRPEAPSSTGSGSKPGTGSGSKSGTGSGNKPATTRVVGSAPRSAPHLDPVDPTPAGHTPSGAKHSRHTPSGHTPSGHTPSGPRLAAARSSGGTPLPGSTPLPAARPPEARPAPAVMLPPPVPAAALGRELVTPLEASDLSHSGHTHSGHTQPGVPSGSRTGLWALAVGATALCGVMVWIWLTPANGAIQATEVPRTDARDTKDVVSLFIDTQPPGAEVWVNGTALGQAPVSLAVGKSDEAGSYEARLSGYGETFGSFVPNQDIRLMLKLTPLTAAERAAPASATPTPREGSTTHSPRRQRSRGSRSTYQPPTPAPAHQTPAAPAPAPSGDPFRRFD